MSKQHKRLRQVLRQAGLDQDFRAPDGKPIKARAFYQAAKRRSVEDRKRLAETLTGRFK